MTEIDLDLDVEYSNYLQTKSSISQLQKNYIIKNLGYDPFTEISEMLKKEITDWGQLTSMDIRVLFNQINGKRKVSEKQLKLLENYSDQKIKIKLNVEEDVDRKELTIRELSRIIQADSRFSIKVEESIITATPKYEYGIQKSDLCEDGKLFYLKFYNLMMLDYDGKSLDEILVRFVKLKITFRVYQTFNGYHVFITSTAHNHSDGKSSRLMRQLGCDEYYIKFSKKYGYKVRLSKKLGRDEEYLAKYIGTYSNIDDYEDPELVKLTQLHDRYVGLTPYQFKLIK